MTRTEPYAPVTVERDPAGAYVVRALTDRGVVELGRHAGLADAWRAIDELDSPVAPLAQAA